MSALVGGNGNTMDIFFNSTFNNFMSTPVMTQMNYFSTLTLHDPAHNIDRSIMPVETEKLL